jgi:hypothetical protein
MKFSFSFLVGAVGADRANAMNIGIALRPDFLALQVERRGG